MSNVSLTTERSISTFIFDGTLSERHQAPVNISSHAIENGSAIADHAILEPRFLTIKGVITATACDHLRSTTRRYNAHHDLMRIRNNRQIITVISGLEKYSSMLIANVIADDSSEGHTLYTVDLQEVTIASTKTSNVANTHIGGHKEAFRSSIKNKPEASRIEEDSANRNQPALNRGSVTGNKVDGKTEKEIKKQSILKGLFS